MTWATVGALEPRGVCNPKDNKTASTHLHARCPGAPGARGVATRHSCASFWMVAWDQRPCPGARHILLPKVPLRSGGPPPAQGVASFMERRLPLLKPGTLS